MIILFFAPRTRSLRILWLLEELGLPYELRPVEFRKTASNFFQQDTPLGKLPTIVDGDTVMCESGAICEYILERYGDGRLAPPADSPARARFLQWLHYAEATAFPPLGMVIWLTRYRSDAESYAAILEASRSRAASALRFLQEQLGESRFLAGDTFTAADIMMGFTLLAARELGLLNKEFGTLDGYLDRLTRREAFQRVMKISDDTAK